MIRLIGILTGSALAIAFLLLLLGVPQLAETRVAGVSETPVQAFVAETDSSAAAKPDPQPEKSGELGSPPEPEVTPEPDATPEPDVTPEPGELPEPGVFTKAEAVPGPQAPDVVEHSQAPMEQNWYAFWSPFRSAIAADGFISELQRTTGLDYRVVKLKPGIYEVAFAYTDDADIKEKLTRISAATGLDMSGG